MDLPNSAVWVDGWTQTVTGDGAISFNGGVATISATAGTAYLRKVIQSSPGEVLTLTFLARRKSGVDGASGRAKIEWPEDSAGEQSVVYIESPEWREYTTSVGAGTAYEGQPHYDIAIGIFSTGAGEIEVAYPRFDLKGSRKGAARVHAYGMVKMVSGVASLEPDFVQSGFSSVAYDAPSKTLTLDTPRGITGFAAMSAPLMFCQITTESGVAPIVAKIGEFQRGDGICKVKFFDTTTGAEVDVSSMGTFYVSVMLVV